MRIFNSEDVISLEVYEATPILKRSLRALPLENFPIPRDENRLQLLRAFENRKQGPLDGMKRVKITLLSDLHYAAVLMDSYRTPRGIYENNMRALRRHLAQYFKRGVFKTGGLSIGKLAQRELIEYAKRLLTIPPTATATERSFSYRKRINSLERANLSKIMLNKLLF